ncbi:MAG: DUF4190 domain-containing protein [Candidatus Pacearchaeota archaeon]|nr:DUF4190 domain-containing protein [Candidatus Pacearchaeota archaeon]
MSKEVDNSFGIASVILGIVGLVMSVFVFPIIISIVGLIFGIVQYKKSKNKWAIWGIVISILGIILALLLIWKIYLIANQTQQLINACMQNPSLAGCETINQMLGVS